MRSRRRWSIHHEGERALLGRVRPRVRHTRARPTLVHGGVSALVLDHMLGEAASEGLTKPQFTGTITCRSTCAGRRWARCVPRRSIERSEGVKDLCARLHFGRRRASPSRRRRVHRAGVGAGRADEVLRQQGVPRTPSEIVEIAKAADDLGYDGMGIPDHVINLETLETPYPYTKDGQRRWEPFTDWPDPWVMIGAIALVTTRLRFVTTVYIPAMRDPYSAAKAIGTAAVLASAGSNWVSASAGARKNSL